MHIAFIGAGSIGQLFATYLGLANPEISITLYVSERYRECLEEKALRLLNLKKEERIAQNISIGKAHNSRENPPDLLILTAKAYSNHEIIRKYKDLISDVGKLVILQNGLGNEPEFQVEFPKISIYRATTTNGALIKNPGEVIHTGQGDTYIGPVQHGNFEEIEHFLALWKKTPIQMEYREDITKICWEKIFINIPINALGALYKVPNGQLVKNRYVMQIMKTALIEAVNVAKALNIDVSDFETYFGQVRTVAEKTAENRNSMLGDLEKGKRTEIDYINGRIAKLGESLGVDISTNKLLTQLIKGKEDYGRP